MTYLNTMGKDGKWREEKKERDLRVDVEKENYLLEKCFEGNKHKRDKKIFLWKSHFLISIKLDQNNNNTNKEIKKIWQKWKLIKLIHLYYKNLKKTVNK